MTRSPRSARRGTLFWAGMTFVALWNGGLLMLALISAHEYNTCVAADGFICFDLSGPILVVMISVDEVVALTLWFLRRHRARRTDPTK